MRRPHIHSALLSLAVLIIGAAFPGCVSPRAETTKSNFLLRLSVRKSDVRFFNGVYIGQEKDHFPPPGGSKPRFLRTDEKYQITRELRMEEFSISLNDRRGYTDSEVKELCYFIASMLTKQRSFSKFTVLSEFSYVTGDSVGTVTARTSGSVIGNTYSGSTTVYTNPIVVNIYSITVLLYDDQDAINQGVFVMYEASTSKSDYIVPLHDLYKGASPGRPDYQSSEDPALGTRVMPNAWKSHYEASELAQALKEKLGLWDPGTIKFEDQKDVDLKRQKERQADPIERLKVKN